MASALTPTMSFGRPGQMHLAGRDHRGDAAVAASMSIQPSWFWRGVQSPNTGCTWLSIRPGATRRALGVDDACRRRRCRRPSALPTAAIRPSTATMRVGVEDRPLEVARQQQTDVPDDELALDRAIRCQLCHGVPLAVPAPIFDPPQTRSTAPILDRPDGLATCDARA